MNSVLYNWLGAAAVSPFVAILSCWTLVVFRSYKREWRLLDLFLFALTALEVSSSLFAFGFAVLNVIRPSLDAPCGFIIWGLVATRTFHLSAVTSLLLDRALSSKWPYTYRSSVRQSQVQYHIVVLAIISAFVGVTAVFARISPQNISCSLHPSTWDLKFSAFLTSVFALMLVVGFVSCLIVQLGRMKSAGSYKTNSHQTWESGTNSSAGAGSSGPLKAEYSESKDLEWTVVACVCWLSYMVNHGPYLVLTSMGLVVPTFWSQWLDVTVIWLRLVQGALVPLLLLVADLPHRSALRNMLRQPGRIYRHLSDHGGFQMQIGDNSCTKPGTLPSVMMFPGAFHPRQRPFNLPQRLRWSPTTLPSLQSLQPAPALNSIQKTATTPLDEGSVRKSDYSTFGDLPSFSSMSSAGFSDTNNGSITMDAVDDFVFHGGTRNCRSPHPSVMTIFRNSPEEPLPRRDTPTPFRDGMLSDYGTCECECNQKSMMVEKEDTVQRNMKDIILAYQSTFRIPRRSRSFEKDSLDTAETTSSDSAEDMSSFGTDDSSESEDSVRSVIIRQSISNSVRTDKLYSSGDCLSNSGLDEKVYEQRIIYSEYL